MKKLHFFILFFYIILTAKAICYEGNLKFGDEPCLNNEAKQIPFASLFDGKLCKEVACMSYLEDSKAYICFRQKVREIKFIIAINATKKTSFDIPVFKDNSTYMLKRVAMSGVDPYNAHITLRLISDDEAYRLAFNINELGDQNDHVKLQHLGHESEVYWLPMLESDHYVVINPNDKALTKISDLPHNNTPRNSVTFDDDPPLYKNSNEPKNCLKWSETVPKTTKSTTVQYIVKTSVASASKTIDKDYFIAIIAFGIILFFFCCIGIPIFCRMNQKNDTTTTAQTEGNDVNTCLLRYDNPQTPSHIQRLLPTLPSEPPLPATPPRPPVALVEHPELTSGPVQLPQSLITPPPSYHTNESFVAGQIFENWITNLIHRLINSQNSSNNIPTPIEEIEMNHVNNHSQNDLAIL